MNNTLNATISLIIFIIILLIKIIINKKNPNDYRDELSKKIKRINFLLVLFSIILFIASFLINRTIEKEMSIKLNILNALSIALISLPLATFNLYKTSIKEKDKYIHITNVITDIVDEKYTKLFNNAGIHLIVLSKTKPKYIKETIEEITYKKSLLNKNIHLKSKELLSKIKGKNIIEENKSLSRLYEEIMAARGVHDNYLRTLKYNIYTFIPLVILYFILKLNGFPFSYSLILIMITKLFMTIMNEFVYKNLPYDTDIPERLPNDSKTLFGTQELILIIIETFIINIFLSIPYMNLMAQGGSQELSNTILYITFVYSNILITLSLLSEQILLKNILKAFKKISLIIYLFLAVGISIFFNFNHYFITRNIGLQNYLGSILMAIIIVIFLELIKFARLTRVKGAKKHGTKNNKKHRRS